LKGTPQDYDEIILVMRNLEKFIDDSTMPGCNPLIKTGLGVPSNSSKFFE